MYSAKIRKFRWSAKFFLLICVPDCHCVGMWVACGLQIGAVRSFFCSFSAVGECPFRLFFIQLRKVRHRVRPSSPRSPCSCPQSCLLWCSAVRWPVQRAAMPYAVHCDGRCSALRFPPHYGDGWRWVYFGWAKSMLNWPSYRRKRVNLRGIGHLRVGLGPPTGACQHVRASGLLVNLQPNE